MSSQRQPPRGQPQSRGPQGQVRPQPPAANGPHAAGQTVRAVGGQQAAEPRPRPLGDRCNPLCPFFRCAQKALRITTEHYRGRPVKVAICALVGDRCVGPQCRYAYCEKRAMLPDGRCSFAVEAKAKSMKSFEEELQEENIPGLRLRGTKGLEEF